MAETISIIFVHHSSNGARCKLARESFESLYESVKHLPVEMIVVDNGGDLEISNYFLKLANENKISHYIRNSNNLWFGYARNQGLKISTGNYICVADNDLTFLPGWLDECLDMFK